MVSLRFRDFLGGYVAEEFDSLVAQLRSFFSVSFNEDGTLQGLDLGLTSLPIGAVSPYAGATSPAGWLFCDGSAVSRVTYKSLFEVVGTTYGAGDGSTTFNIPDIRQRFPLGKAAAGTGAALGATGGAIDHSHSGGSHTHTISSGGSHSHTVDDHSHAIPATGTLTTTQGNSEVRADGPDLDAFDVWAATGQTDGGHTHNLASHDHGGSTNGATPGTDSQGSHDHGGSTGSSSGSTGTENPPFISLNYIILAGA
jgi:microcystin-dependent protein